MFSEYYFYLAAFIDNEETRKDFDVINDSYPTIYRIDRIKDFKVFDEKIPYTISVQFEEGEFRNEYSLCLVENFGKVNLNIWDYPLSRFLIGLPTAKGT